MDYRSDDYANEIGAFNRRFVDFAILFAVCLVCWFIAGTQGRPVTMISAIFER